MVAVRTVDKKRGAVRHANLLSSQNFMLTFVYPI